MKKIDKQEADGAMCLAIILVIVGGLFAYFVSYTIIHPPKSARLACSERGGEWVDLRSGGRCFAKDSFK